MSDFLFEIYNVCELYLDLTEEGWKEERENESENVGIIYNRNKSLSIEQQRMRLPIFNVILFFIV